MENSPQIHMEGLVKKETQQPIATTWDGCGVSTGKSLLHDTRLNFPS